MLLTLLFFWLSLCIYFVYQMSLILYQRQMAFTCVFDPGNAVSQQNSSLFNMVNSIRPLTRSIALSCYHKPCLYWSSPPGPSICSAMFNLLTKTIQCNHYSLLHSIPCNVPLQSQGKNRYNSCRMWLPWTLIGSNKMSLLGIVDLSVNKRGGH